MEIAKMSEKRTRAVKFKVSVDRIDLPCGCILEWAPSELDFDQWIVAEFCAKHKKMTEEERTI